MKFLQALPPYFGGKQRLLKHIFGLIPPSSQAPVLADAFMGGGSVSLFAKAMGYKVLCNDLAERSAVIGRGLIENSRVKLNKWDAGAILQPNDYTFCIKDAVIKYFTDEDKVNDAVFSNAQENTFSQMDVLQFLEQTRADIAYFDPPYYGSSPYEERYKILDWILSGEIREPEISDFNKQQAYQLIEDMLARAEWAKYWVISYGGPKVDRREFLAIVQKHRPKAVEIPLKYRYSFGNQKKDSEKRETEILIYAERG